MAEAHPPSSSIEVLSPTQASSAAGAGARESRHVVPTEDFTVLSSLHGRKRRKQRDISKRDLQVAVKYGTKTPASTINGKLRWKYTHNNISYITDETSRVEITAWSVNQHQENKKPDKETKKAKHSRQIPEMHVDTLHHNMQASAVSTRPATVTSHTVLVVDMSGSMRNRDVTAGSTRAQAVYENLAQYFVKAQLDSRRGYDKNSRMLDVVSLIEMRDTSTIIFEALPLDGHLFNMLMQRKTAKPFSHGNYLPSLDSAEQLLNKVSQK